MNSIVISKINIYIKNNCSFGTKLYCYTFHLQGLDEALAKNAELQKEIDILKSSLKRPCENSASPSSSSKLPKLDRTFDIELVRYGSKFYFAKINRKSKKVRYCETEIKKLKGRFDIINEYKFSNEENAPIPDKDIVKRLPEKHQVLSGQKNKVVFDVNARIELGEFLFG